MPFLLFLPLFTVMSCIHISQSSHESRHLHPSLPLALTAASSIPRTTAAISAATTAAAVVRNDSFTQMHRPRDSRSTSSLHPSGNIASDAIRSASLRRLSTQVLCEGDQLQLACENSSRIIVINAWFGVMGMSKIRKSLGLQPLSCQQTISGSGARSPLSSILANSIDGEANRDSKCRVVQVTSAIAKHCHARRKCSLTADVATLISDPSNATSRTCQDDVSGLRKKGRTFNQLKVQYTCASKSVFKTLPNPARLAPTTGSSTIDSQPFVPDHGSDLFQHLTPVQRQLIQASAPAFPVAPAAVSDSRKGGKVGKVSSESHPSPGRSRGSEYLPDLSGSNAHSQDALKDSSSTMRNSDASPGKDDEDRLQPQAEGPAVSITGSDEVSRISTTASTSQSTNCTIIISKFNHPDKDHSHSIGFAGDWISAYVFMTLLSCRLYCSKRRAIMRVKDESLYSPPIAVMIGSDSDDSPGSPLVDSGILSHHPEQRADPGSEHLVTHFGRE